MAINMIGIHKLYLQIKQTVMKQLTAILTIFIASLGISSCSVIGGIFNAGMSVGIFITVFFIAIILFLVVRMGRKRNNNN